VTSGGAAGMATRRVASLVILAAFLALAVLSVLGNPVLGGVFIVVAGAVLGHHAISLCPRCSNLACAFNPASSKSEPPAYDGAEVQGFSHLPITRTTVVPLLLTGPLAFIGAWQYRPLAAVTLAVVVLGAHTVFTRLTCSRCGNDCAGNCNPSYRHWRDVRRAAGG
jgi:hypothetical protein